MITCPDAVSSALGASAKLVSLCGRSAGVHRYSAWVSRYAGSAHMLVWSHEVLLHRMPLW